MERTFDLIEQLLDIVEVNAGLYPEGAPGVKRYFGGRLLGNPEPPAQRSIYRFFEGRAGTAHRLAELVRDVLVQGDSRPWHGIMMLQRRAS